MTRNPTHLPLKKRLTDRQQFRRRQKLMTHGTWRTDMERNHAKLQGAMVGGFQSFGREYLKHRWYTYALLIVHTAALVALAGVVLGWW